MKCVLQVHVAFCKILITNYRYKGRSSRLLSLLSPILSCFACSFNGMVSVVLIDSSFLDTHNPTWRAGIAQSV